MSGGDREDRNWALLRPLIAVHTLLYRATGGRVGHHVRGTPPMLLLEHIGARSGVRRRAPLGYLRDDLGVVIVASKGGHRHHPSWFHNLQAHPDTVVQIGSKHQPVHARIAASDERRMLWPKVVGLHPGYDDYQRRTEREIPLVILESR